MALPAAAQPVNTGHVQAELVAESQGIAPGQTIHVALRQQIEKGWHTYWRNSGDSGEATRITWTLPTGWQAGAFTWPAPRQLPVGPLMNYGYEGEVLLPVAITAPATAQPGQTIQLAAKAQFLVCAEICVPEDANLTLALPVTAGPAQPDPKWGKAITQTLAEAPKPAGLAAVFQPRGTSVALAVTGAAIKAANKAGAYFYPFDATVIDHAKPQAIEQGPDGLTLTLTSGYAFQGGKAPGAMEGVLAVGGKTYEISAGPGAPPAGAAGLGPPAVKGASGGDLGLATAAVFALIGGLILNLMPCVFPILAMKAASRCRRLPWRPKAQKGASAEGLAFMARVLDPDLPRAGRRPDRVEGRGLAGDRLGLPGCRSPPVVAVLCAPDAGCSARNLSSLFEVGTLAAGDRNRASPARGGLAGAAFFTGALAVVVAAPCTAALHGARRSAVALTQTPVARPGDRRPGAGDRRCRPLRAGGLRAGPALAPAAARARGWRRSARRWRFPDVP